MRWKTITGNENYKISECGRVYSNHVNREMKTYIINSGYKAIKLANNGESKSELIHRLVAKEFCEGYSPELDVNHIDGNKLNNHYSNLEWVTRKENIHHNMKRGVFDVETAQKVAWEKNKKPVIMLDPDTGEELMEFESQKEAKDYLNLGKTASLTDALNGTRRIRFGYGWKFKNSEDIV